MRAMEISPADLFRFFPFPSAFCMQMAPSGEFKGICSVVGEVRRKGASRIIHKARRDPSEQEHQPQSSQRTQSESERREWRIGQGGRTWETPCSRELPQRGGSSAPTHTVSGWVASALERAKPPVGGTCPQWGPANDRARIRISHFLGQV